MERSLLINSAVIMFLGSDGPGTAVLFRGQSSVLLHLMSVLRLLQFCSLTVFSFMPRLLLGMNNPKPCRLLSALWGVHLVLAQAKGVFSVWICRAELRITFLVCDIVCYDSPIPWTEDPGLTLKVLGPSSS